MRGEGVVAAGWGGAGVPRGEGLGGLVRVRVQRKGGGNVLLAGVVVVLVPAGRGVEILSHLRGAHLRS